LNRVDTEAQVVVHPVDGVSEGASPTVVRVEDSEDRRKTSIFKCFEAGADVGLFRFAFDVSAGKGERPFQPLLPGIDHVVTP
jgi:hypothetical protein